VYRGGGKTVPLGLDAEAGAANRFLLRFARARTRAL
jgi:hypothetical protein